VNRAITGDTSKFSVHLNALKLNHARKFTNYEIKMKFITISIMLLTFSSISFSDVTRGTKEVLLDNDTVEVVRVTYPVGSESGMHTHIYPNRIVYFVKGGKLELIPEDKSQQRKVIDVLDGKTLFLPATTHNVKNIGNTEIIIVESEIKNS
jgi:quercetin dioxygenase-like cupin family protein